MAQESETMKELHAIREEIYNETKSMTPEQEVEYFNSQSAKIKEQFFAGKGEKSGVGR